MLNGDGNENGKKKSVGVIGEKKNILSTCRTLFCTFLCRCCSNVKLPSSTSYGENVIVACVAVRLFFSLPLIFTLSVRISYFLSSGISCCSSNEIRLLCFFISRFSLSVTLFLFELR